MVTTGRSATAEDACLSKNAIVIPLPGDLTGNLANAIFYLFQNKELQKEMGDVSLTLSKKYSKENYARNFFEAITLPT